MQPIQVTALYKFVSLPDYESLQAPLKDVCEKNGVMGTLLLAQEGINGTIAGSPEGIAAVLNYLKSDARFADLDHKESYCDEMPFYRMKVRLKKEIVTLGVPGIDPNKQVGEYVDPQQWNALLTDPEVVVLDTRNDYEFEVGTFRNSLNPNTKSFREFPKYVEENLDPKKHKKIAMHCTGGIRCEKASAYMLAQGFEKVYHLKGGILKYLETVNADESLWDGECFVFDNRVTVKNGLEVGSYGQCFGCRYPLSQEEMQSPLYVKGVCCPKCYDEFDGKHKERAGERQKQIELAKARNQAHIGAAARPAPKNKDSRA